jgi:hypothetical protein
VIIKAAGDGRVLSVAKTYKSHGQLVIEVDTAPLTEDAYQQGLENGATR